VIFINSPSILNAPQELSREEVLCDSDQGLEQDEDISDKTEDTMNGDKVGMVALVDFDDNKC
jgi:hypothetical protein